MEVRIMTDEDGTQRKHYIAAPGEHVLMTGPISGIVSLADGKQVNLTPDFIVVDSPEQAAEVNDLIGKHWVENGHPEDIDILEDPETGSQVPVQRPFVFTTSEGETLTGIGTPVGEHDLDEANGITAPSAPAALADPTDSKES